MEGHESWLKQIDAELDGELSLRERAALAKHLATCSACAGARASHLEVRVALAQSAGDPHARTVPRPVIRARVVVFWVVVALAAGALAGWFGYQRWGGPSPRSLEASRAAIVVQ